LSHSKGTKVVNPEEALSKIRDGSIVAVSGFNMLTTPEYLLLKLYELYKRTGHPKDLFFISDTLPAAPNMGFDLIAKDIYENKDYGFLRGVLFPFLGWSEYTQKLILENLIEGYTWPIGIMAWWFREVACGRPGVLTKVGLGTFLDPRYEGGLLNDLARERKTYRVTLVSLDGEEYLLYKGPKPNVALIRGTTADEMGNVRMEEEGILGTVLNIAQASKAGREKGLVVAQVLRVTPFGGIKPKEVTVPGPLIDYIVIAPRERHKQSASIDYDPLIAGVVIPSKSMTAYASSNELNTRKVVARRVALEMSRLVMKFGRPIIINLGIGIPAEVARVVLEEEITDYIFPTVESGPWGGDALYGADFGASRGPYAILHMPDQFALYEGGIIDAASLGFMQINERGDVNPSVVANRVTGPGGFPVISSGSPRIYFAGEFTAGDRDIEVKNGQLLINKDGPVLKFVKTLNKTVWNASEGLKKGQEVMYITERAVFKLTPNGLKLIEVAPNIDIEKHILSKMEFKPIIEDYELMDPRLFKEGKVGLKEEIEKALRR